MNLSERGHAQAEILATLLRGKKFDAILCAGDLAIRSLQKLTTGIPAVDLGRIALAVSPQNPDVQDQSLP